MKRRLRTTLWPVLALVLLLVGCALVPTRTPTPPTSLQVHYIDVGQGDAILILTPEGKAALIDGGEAGSGALQYLRNKGVRKLDLVVASNGRSDHLGGLAEVLKAIPTDEVVSNGQPQTSLAYERFQQAVSKSRARHRVVRRGDSLALGGLKLDVLSPAPSVKSDSENNQSLVLRLTYGQTAFLFEGDAEKEAEDDMMAAGLNLNATVLKLGYHGSSTASTLPFLQRVKPVMAVYFAGAGNQWHLPSQSTLTRLNSLGVQTFGTDINGTIVITSDGQSCNVTTAKGNGPWVPATPNS